LKATPEKASGQKKKNRAKEENLGCLVQGIEKNRIEKELSFKAK